MVDALIDFPNHLAWKDSEAKLWTTRLPLQAKLRILLASILAISLSACGTIKQPPLPPPPVVTGAALALPAVGATVPVYVFLRTQSDLQISVSRDQISGITQHGAVLPALALEDAASAAGGTDKLLAALSDETEIGHVAKAAGAVFGGSTLAGLGGGCGVGGDPTMAALFCAGGGALGAAIGIVGAVGVGTYLGVSKHARQIDMLSEVELPKDLPGTPRQGYIFLPTESYGSLKLIVKDPRTSVSQQIEIKVEPGKLSAPGQAPEVSS